MNAERLLRLKLSHPQLCGGSVQVRRMEEDWGSTVIVFGDPNEGWYDWALLDDDDRVMAQSDCQYGSPTWALRDGLLYADTQMVLLGGTKAEAHYLGTPPEWMGLRVDAGVLHVN